MGVAIVAVPPVDEGVWKVSTEKVPHLTILYLDEEQAQAAASDISQFIQHAATTTLNRFGLSVERRGTLGDDQADVLFFEHYGSTMEDLRDFRSQLLKNDNIKKAYDAADQFPNWTPHLTLGYPDNPAKDEAEIYLGYVEFDHIAIWFGEFEGPEFLLDRRRYEAEIGYDVYHALKEHDLIFFEKRSTSKVVDKGAQFKAPESYGKVTKRRAATKEENEWLRDHPGEWLQVDEDGNTPKDDSYKKTKMKGREHLVKHGTLETKPELEDTLIHYGVKGMKWGVRNDHSAQAAQTFSSRGAGERAFRKDYPNEKYMPKSLIRAVDAAHAKRKADALKEAKKVPGFKNEVAEARAGRGIIAQARSDSPGHTVAIKHLYGGTLTSHSVSTSGSFKDRNGNTVSDDFANAVMDEAAKRRIAAPNSKPLTDREMEDAVRDVNRDLRQSSIPPKGSLLHYGVKGMKWGVRRSERALAKMAPSEVSVITPAGQRVKTAGGRNQPASDDAITAAKIRQKARASTLDSLTNNELKALTQRMNLESQYKDLSNKLAPPKSKGRKFVSNLFKDQKKRKMAANGLRKGFDYGRAAQGLGNDLANIRL